MKISIQSDEFIQKEKARLMLIKKKYKMLFIPFAAISFIGFFAVLGGFIGFYTVPNDLERGILLTAYGLIFFVTQFLLFKITVYDIYIKNNNPINHNYLCEIIKDIESCSDINDSFYEAYKKRGYVTLNDYIAFMRASKERSIQNSRDQCEKLIHKFYQENTDVKRV